MLLLAVLAVAATGAWAEQAVQAVQVQAPAAAYGPPATAYGPPATAYAAPAPASVDATDLAALIDGATYQQYPNAYSYSDPAFSVQTGYEGYLVPVEQEGHPGHPDPAALAGLGLLSKLIPFPKLGLKLFPKLGVFFLGFLFLLLIGGALTTAVCALTPFCTLSFLGLATRNSMRSYLTPDRLTQTTAFVLDAIDKYKDFSKKVQAKEGRSKKDRRRR